MNCYTGCLMQKSKFKIGGHSFHLYKDFRDEVTGLCSGGSHFETRHVNRLYRQIFRVFLSFLSPLSEWYLEIGYDPFRPLKFITKSRFVIILRLITATIDTELLNNLPSIDKHVSSPYLILVHAVQRQKLYAKRRAGRRLQQHIAT